jgi:hypothetical protein
MGIEFQIDFKKTYQMMSGDKQKYYFANYFQAQKMKTKITPEDEERHKFLLDISQGDKPDFGKQQKASKKSKKRHRDSDEEVGDDNLYGIFDNDETTT